MWRSSSSGCQWWGRKGGRHSTDNSMCATRLSRFSAGYPGAHVPHGVCDAYLTVWQVYRHDVLLFRKTKPKVVIMVGGGVGA
jgi:hypothetical protein